MMHNGRFKLYWYEAKATYPELLWGLVLVTGAWFVVFLSPYKNDNLEYFILIVEIVAPLGIMFIANGLIFNEYEKGILLFLAIRSSLPILWLRRLGSLLSIATLWLALLLAISRLFYPALPIGKMITAFLGGSVALSGMSSAISLALKDRNVGLLVGVFWWGFCLVSSRVAFAILGPYSYLFYLWFRFREGVEPVAWALNKSALSVIGFLAIVVGVFCLRSTERFFTS